jgi:hypothetical protein
MKLIAVIFLAAILLFLIRRNLLQVDLSFPLFAGLIVLGFASLNHEFIEWIAAKLDVADAPRAIIMIILAILVALSTSLAIAYSRLRQRQILLVRHVIRTELRAQEDFGSYTRE